MKTAVIFSGQGSQFAGMGRDLYDNYAVCRDLFDRAEEAAGFPLKSICFDEDKAETLNNTRFCQASILTLSMAALRLIEEQYALRPVCTAGLSLGEYTALTYSGAIGFEDAVKLLRDRGAFMADACEATDGVMSAVMGISEEDAYKTCAEASTENEPVNVSNINTIGQVVISGNRLAVERAEAIAKNYGGKRAIRLPVSGAYHSAYMESAARKLEECMKNIKFMDMVIPVVSNVNAAIIKSRDSIAATLVKQICAAVKWADCVRKMAALEVDTFIEIGPGKALSGFVKKILPDVRVFNVQDTASLVETLRGLEA
ncbi:MAG: ACP S-malonyltransferase [Defluviitaleaceae bacterium]|nr:ACP S-malonyltransferase [Defluviitaleaceae bacterium]MCL2837259.1 ACP S-malonyltransferase [Defluviitaleaceae bacterium]